MKRDELRNRRKELELTQQNVADEVGISRSFYTRIELGKEDPHIKTACKIASVLDTDVGQVFKDLESAYKEIFLFLNVRSTNKKAV